MSSPSAHVVALALNGTPPSQIARQLALKVDKVYAIIRRARSDGTDIPVFTTRKWVPAAEKSAQEAEKPQCVPKGCNITTIEPVTPQIAVPIRLHSLLVSEAERKGWTPSELAQYLLERALLEGWSRHAR